MEKLEDQNIEIKLLLEAIFLKYGYDFRNYSEASVKRRVLNYFVKSGLNNLSELLHKVLCDERFFNSLLLELSINVTEMFRDPKFYKALREKVIPILKTYPFLKIWHAGCSSGEEVYSMAILLKEEGLYEKSQIYATDFNEVILKKAKDGIFQIENLKDYTLNYQKAGGKNSFAEYYSANYEFASINKSLKKNIVFADHNLVTDGVFGEMNLILCRNVLIYFNRDLQNRVFKLFSESLCHNGILCLGSKESLRFANCSEDFEGILESEKIYRKRT